MRLQLESLENRVMLHGGAEFAPLDNDISDRAVRLRGDTLIIRGDRHANAIDLSLSESGGDIEVRVDNLGPTIFDASQVRSFIIRGKGGNDDISVGVDLPGKIRGGAGDDEIGGGPGSERIWGGPGNDMVDGGAGNDTVRGGGGSDRFMPAIGNDRRPDFRDGKDIEDGPIINVAPTANSQNRMVTVESTLPITLSGDDGDDGVQQTLSFQIQSLPASGALQDSAGNAIVVGQTLPSALVNYTPNAGFVGSDSFTFIVVDNGGIENGGQDTSAPATVSLTIPANQRPTSNPQSISTAVDSERSITLTGDDGDPDATQAVSFRVETLPSNGSLRDGNGNSVTVGSTLSSAIVRYQPNAGFSGSDSFTFVTMDDGGTAGGGQDTSLPATVTIAVSSANLQPTANPQSVNVSRDTTTNITLTGDDGDPGITQTVSFRIQTLPGNGTLRTATGGTVTVGAILPNGNLRYAPSSGFTGNDSFSFVVVDDAGTSGGGQDTSEPATVSLIVTQPNAPFPEVTTGDFDDPGLLGIRTDLVAGAPPITSEHATTAIDFSAHSNPPTYGDHHAAGAVSPRPAGIYSTAQPDEDLIHNLEHGHVWISYNPTLISSADLAALEQFVTAGGANAGVILTPRPKNTDVVAAASWGRLLTLDRFDAAELRDFVVTNRGHAPEGFIAGVDRPDAQPPLDGLPHTL